MKQYFIEKEDVKARISEWGKKENPTIICIHGLGGTNLSFLEVGELLKEEYNVISIDLPGHGETPAFKNDEDYEIPNLINWLEKVIDSVEKKEFYLLAHSWGGCVALHYSHKNPKRVKNLMLLDGGYHLKEFSYDYYSKKDKTKMKIKPFCSLKEEIAFYEKDFDEYIFFDWEEFFEVEKEVYLRWSDLIEVAAKDLMKVEEDGRIRFCATGDVARGAIKSMYKFPTDVLYKELNLPILLLQANIPKDMDEYRTLQTEMMKKDTNAVVKKVELTHMLHWDNPEFVADEARNWFK